MISGLQLLQLPDGSILSSTEGGESDMRFLFCAAAISAMIHDFSGLDVDKAVDYVIRSISYEGGIGQGPGLEAHGGSTYCAVAALKLMGRLEDAFTPRHRRRLERWCLNRLVDGFNGRPNKPEDTCYSFWIGASIAILRPFDDVDTFVGQSAEFVLRTQDDVIGGLAKWEDHSVDPLHTYLGLSGLAIAGLEGLEPVEPALNVSKRIAQRLLIKT